MEAPDQGLDADRDAVDTGGRHPREAVTGVDIQEKVLTIHPADLTASGQPLLAKVWARPRLLGEGRVTLGVGWLEEEFRALGITWERRAQRTREYMESMRRLCGNTMSSYAASSSISDLQVGVRRVVAGTN
jgi:hypothetical protein